MTSRKPYNNTAGRLLALFCRAAQTGNANSPSHVVWQIVLGLSQTPSPNLTDVEHVVLRKRMLPIQHALEDVEAEVIEKRPDDQGLLLRYFPDLWSAAVPRNIQERWAEYGKNLGVAQLDMLEMCAHGLPADAGIGQDELDQIYKAVNDLFEQVRKSRINSPLKKWLLELLAKIKSSIDDYWILGPKAFKKALVTMSGEMALQPKAMEAVRNEDESLFSGFGGVFVRCVDLASKVHGAMGLLEYAGPIVDNLPMLLGFSVGAAAAVRAIGTQKIGDASRMDGNDCKSGSNQLGG